MGTYDELAKLDRSSPTRDNKTRLSKRQGGVARQATSRPAIRPTDQPAIRPANQPFSWPTEVDDLGLVVGTSKSFYITRKVDSWLDDAVRYLRSKDLHKVDRSVVINALLHSPDLFEPEHLDKIRERLLAHLTNKFMSRDQSTD